MKNILECSHSQMHLKWVSNLNNESAQLVFVANGSQIWAIHDELPMDREVFAALVDAVKTECSGICLFIVLVLGLAFFYCGHCVL